MQVTEIILERQHYWGNSHWLLYDLNSSTEMDMTVKKCN